MYVFINLEQFVNHVLKISLGLNLSYIGVSDPVHHKSWPNPMDWPIADV